MVEFAVENYHAIIEEMKLLFDAHWQEIALDQDVIKLNPDYEQYGRLADADILMFVTARDQGRLVGYCVCVIRPHLHYRDSITGLADIFYVKPEYRQGMTGVKLFKKTEEFLKARGVQRIVMNTKLHHDVGRIFERLGYKETERIFTKIIG